MPRRDLKRHHDELVNDERGEGDGEHAIRRHGASEDLRKTLDDDALVNTDEEPDGEGAVGKGCAWSEFFVELWIEVG